MKRSAIVLAAALAAATVVSADTQTKDVDIKASDGVTLKGTYFSPGRPGPAMLLLHQCNMDRHAWDGLAKDLADAGLHVLAIDYRGYGESGGEHFTDMAQRRPVMEQKWPGDVDAAYAYLLAQKGVDRTHVAAGGASCGVTQSSDLATRHHEIKALMLLSGTASDTAKTYIAGTPGLPVFGVASQEDASAAKGITEAIGASKNPRSLIKIYPGSEHGVPMFAQHRELKALIVAWMQLQLKGQGPTH
jgi:dienelactone hydrolase